MPRRKVLLTVVTYPLPSRSHDELMCTAGVLENGEWIRIYQLEIEETDREWKNEWKEIRKQGDLFSQDKNPEIIIRKLPYKFYYRFTDDTGKSSRLMIEDWEIGQLYWNCLKKAEGNEAEALEKVRQRYEQEFIGKKDINFFLGTTK